MGGQNQYPDTVLEDCSYMLVKPQRSRQLEPDGEEELQPECLVFSDACGVSSGWLSLGALGARKIGREL